MQVAGGIAELANSRDFEAIFQARLAAPLGMRDSGYVAMSQEPGFSPMLGGSLCASMRDYTAS